MSIRTIFAKRPELRKVSRLQFLRIKFVGLQITHPPPFSLSLGGFNDTHTYIVSWEKVSLEIQRQHDASKHRSMVGAISLGRKTFRSVVRALARFQTFKIPGQRQFGSLCVRVERLKFKNEPPPLKKYDAKFEEVPEDCDNKQRETALTQESLPSLRQMKLFKTLRIINSI